MPFVLNRQKQDFINHLEKKEEKSWVRVRERMQELFVELGWDVLESLPREERVQTVKEQAKAKMAGVGDIYVDYRWSNSRDM